MEKIVIVTIGLLLVIFSISIVVYNQKPTDPVSRPYPLDSDISQQNLDTCQIDDDCVPFPSCHSEICINKIYLSHYPDKSTYSCTEIFTPCEATSGECICQNNKCVNNRLETIGCINWKERLNK